MVEPEDARRLVMRLVKSAIDDLVSYYLENPFHFYTESDLHCHLFSSILQRLCVSWLNKPWKTLDGKMSILLHKEYPTKARYRRNRAPLEPEKAARGARGHFDLCLWDPFLVGERFFRSDGGVYGQETFVAVELDLVENRVRAQEALHHVKWDLLKLSDADNRVEHGFMLFFVRDWLNRDAFVPAYERCPLSFQEGAIVNALFEAFGELCSPPAPENPVSPEVWLGRRFLCLSTRPRTL